MDIAIAVLGALLILVIGRNDGTLLIAIALRGLSVNQGWVAFLIVGVLPLAPLLGIYLVAQAFHELIPVAEGGDVLVLGLFVSTILTVIMSLSVRAPNSITLALIGAASGAALGLGLTPEWPHVVFVLLMAAAAPIVGSVLAAVVPYGAVHSSSPRVAKVLSLGSLRWPALLAIAISYSLNDGQKLVFIVAAGLAVPVMDVAGSLAAHGVALALFALGMLSGMRGLASLLAHGVLRTTPISAVWAQVSTSLTLVGGSLIGAPMSMTQTLQGSLLGSGLKRGTKVVRWRSVWRIALAWLWTLPLSGVLAFICVRLVNGVSL